MDGFWGRVPSTFLCPWQPVMFQAHSRHSGNGCERNKERVGMWEKGEHIEGGSGYTEFRELVLFCGICHLTKEEALLVIW